MKSHADGNQYKQESEGPMLCNKNRTVQESQPQHGDRQHLHPQGDSLMNLEVPYICTKLRVIHQPCVKLVIPFQEQCCGKKKPGSGRKNRQEYAYYP